MYWKDTYEFLNSNDIEYKWEGKYGAKGEKRQPKKKATPEQIRRQNQWKREQTVWRKIRWNFYEGDLWTTLTFPEGTRKSLEEIKKIMKNFFSNMRRAYRKRERQLLWIMRIEIGKHGGIHIHVVMNKIRSEPTTDELVQKYWKKQGYVNFTPLYEDGDFRRLANYIVKPLPKEDEDGYEQLSMFTEEEKKECSVYSCSKNLITREPERKKYYHWTVKKIIENGPEPTPGYYINPESIVCGVNKYTGLSYLRYTEVRIKPLERNESG